MAVGALIAVAIVVWAARQKPEGPIEVAGSADQARRILVVASEEIGDPGSVSAIARAAGVDAVDAEAEILILTPARTGFLDRWATDLQAAREEAQRKLVISVASLAAAHVEASGQVGDNDLVQATEDTLRSFPATEVILATGPDERDRAGARAADQLSEALPVPFKHLVVSGG
jgi:predicted TIM-barrel enzyme